MATECSNMSAFEYTHCLNQVSIYRTTCPLAFGFRFSDGLKFSGKYTVGMPPLEMAVEEYQDQWEG